MAARLQPLQLFTFGLTASHRTRQDTAGTAKLQGLQLDLPSKLAGRSQYENNRTTLHIGLAVVNMGEGGPQESERLAAPALGDADEVVTCTEDRPTLRLNWRRLHEASLVHLVDHVPWQARGFELPDWQRHHSSSKGADDLHVSFSPVLLCSLRLCRRGESTWVPHGRAKNTSLHSTTVSRIKPRLIGLPLVLLVNTPSAEVLRPDAFLPLGLSLLLPVEAEAESVLIILSRCLLSHALVASARSSHAGGAILHVHLGGPRVSLRTRVESVRARTVLLRASTVLLQTRVPLRTYSIPLWTSTVLLRTSTVLLWTSAACTSSPTPVVTWRISVGLAHASTTSSTVHAEPTRVASAHAEAVAHTARKSASTKPSMARTESHALP
mmetsp:Transcript_64991/g.171982  ORF Transcript_64991/g.171982 Transcript_64991/m.171982 type:complete len:382 (+) Transcript_64991:1186-2331(+)